MFRKSLFFVSLLICTTVYSQELECSFDASNHFYLFNNPVQLEFNLNDRTQELMWHPGKDDLIKAISIINFCINNHRTKVYDINTDKYNPIDIIDSDIKLFKSIDFIKRTIIIERTSNKLYEHLLSIWLYDKKNIAPIIEILVSIENEWIIIKTYNPK